MALRSVRDLRGSPTAAGTSGSRLAVRRALVCFALAYLAVTVLAAALTVTYAAINHTAAADAAASSPVRSPSFSATVPYHVLIMVLVWPAFAWLYFRRPGVAGARGQVRESLLLSAAWVLGAILVDFIGFVVVKNPWSLTPHQFYVDYQPWITLIYIAILLSPWVRLAAVGLATVRAGGRPAG